VLHEIFLGALIVVLVLAAVAEILLIRGILLDSRRTGRR
jgi:hypothetical protein